MKRFTKTFPLLALAISFNATAQFSALAIDGFHEIQGSRLLDLNDGTYKIKCELDKNDAESYVTKYSHFFPVYTNSGLEEILIQKFSEQIPIKQAELELTFTLRDGEISRTNRLHNQPKFNNFKLVALSQDFKIGPKLPAKPILDPRKNEYSVFFSNLTKEEIDLLPVHTNEAFYGAYGHTNPAFNSVTPSSNVKRLNMKRSSLFQDGAQVHPALQDQIVVSGLGSVAESDIIIDPANLTGMLTLPAASVVFGPQPGRVETSPGGTAVVAFKYGTIKCKMFAKD